MRREAGSLGAVGRWWKMDHILMVTVSERSFLSDIPQNLMPTRHFKSKYTGGSREGFWSNKESAIIKESMKDRDAL